jgi:uncharacterized RDD family membrane protein YckC
MRCVQRSVRVRTPEAIAFSYELAGLGSRWLALFVDSLIQLALGIGLLILGFDAAARAPDLAKLLHLNGKNLASAVAAVVILAFASLLLAYFTAFECLWNGQTPGKRVLGIRVVRDGGFAVDFMGALLRNIVRLFEMALGAYAVSAVVMLLSPENKRLGDYAAGTIVVRDRGLEVADPGRWLRDDAATDVPAWRGALTPEEIDVVDRFLARRSTLPPDAARRTAAKIASLLRPKLGPQAGQLSDEELLVAIGARAERRARVGADAPGPG